MRGSKWLGEVSSLVKPVEQGHEVMGRNLVLRPMGGQWQRSVPPMDRAIWFVATFGARVGASAGSARLTGK